MKGVVFVLAVVMMVLAHQPIAEAGCDYQLDTEGEIEMKKLGVPTIIIAKVVGADVEVTLEFQQAVTFKLYCGCRPCCEHPKKQFASLSVSSSIQAFGGTVVFGGAATREQEGKERPSETEGCFLPVELGYQEGTRVPALGVGLSLGGFTFKTESVRLSFSQTGSCECTDDPKCFGNTAPTIVDVSPRSVDLNKGASATVIVKASDAEGNLADFPSKIEVAEPGYLPVVRVSQWFNEDRTLGKAEYRVDFPQEGEDLWKSVLVSAWDECGKWFGKTINVRLFYPPVLIPIPEESGWYGDSYVLRYRVEDPDFKGCYQQERWEEVRIFVEKVECGRTYSTPHLFSCLCEECRTGAVVFSEPEGDCCDRWFKVVAKDSSPAGAQSHVLFIRVPNRAPTVQVDPKELKARPGQTLRAAVATTDPDGDTVTLTQTSGPGSLAPVQGRGSARGTWTWEVPEKLRSFSTWVGFVAKDLCGGVGYGFLHLCTMNPPEVSDTYALVLRGGEGEAYAYVHDPDSPWVSVSLGSVPPGLAVSASVEDDPFAPGMGGFMVAFHVSADPTLCEGVYTVPFTVTDPDGLSSSATLHVRVVGNRPPLASPPVIQGETTVVLTPTGIVYTPVVFEPLRVWDPDGDQVTIEGYGIPPTYAANISAFFGSLVALYTPGGLTDEDLCCKGF